MRDQSGTVLIETVILGFAVAAMVIPLLLMVGALGSSKASTQTLATDVAAWVARHGELPDAPDMYEISVDAGADEVTVTVTERVPVLAVLDAGPTIAITSTATWTVSPYRSDRDG